MISAVAAESRPSRCAVASRARTQRTRQLQKDVQD